MFIMGLLRVLINAKMLDFKLQAVGVNGLVRLTRLVSDVENRAQIKFRELNARYKPTQWFFLTELKISCDIRCSNAPSWSQRLKIVCISLPVV